MPSPLPSIKFMSPSLAPTTKTSTFCQIRIGFEMEIIGKLRCGVRKEVDLTFPTRESSGEYALVPGRMANMHNTFYNRCLDTSESRLVSSAVAVIRTACNSPSP